MALIKLIYNTVKNECSEGDVVMGWFYGFNPPNYDQKFDQP